MMMGSYSEVHLACGKKVFEAYKEILEQTFTEIWGVEESTYTMPKPDQCHMMMRDGKEYYHIAYDWVKWYGSHQGVQAVNAMLAKFQSAEYEEDEEAAFHFLEYYFDEDSITQQYNTMGYELLGSAIEVTIKLDPDFKEVDLFKAS
jgi:hypothetical protein